MLLHDSLKSVPESTGILGVSGGSSLFVDRNREAAATSGLDAKVRAPAKLGTAFGADATVPIEGAPTVSGADVGAERFLEVRTRRLLDSFGICSDYPEMLL